ncbi:MAG: hypothetical protein WC755_02130 [Candidatus Woesearchaeota archaeon]|jgi:hypothetical protein
MSEKKPFSSLLQKHKDRDFIICCPGKNILEYYKKVVFFVKKKNLITIGSNKITELIPLYYHMFTNNDKYDSYGNLVRDDSILMLGENIIRKYVKRYKPKEYVAIKYEERDPIEYNSDNGMITGIYRTSGNLAIMLCHLMGARMIYIAGMSGFTYKFDGKVHYYKAEMKKDKKTKETWYKNYDKPVMQSLDNLKNQGIKFSIITPTMYNKHYDGSVLNQELL